jgi:hypothetical protein
LHPCIKISTVPHKYAQLVCFNLKRKKEVYNYAPYRAIIESIVYTNINYNIEPGAQVLSSKALVLLSQEPMFFSGWPLQQLLAGGRKATAL